MITGHDRTIEPSIIFGTNETFAHTFRSSANRNRWLIRVYLDGPGLWEDACRYGFESDDG
jgi:hypothetical protein